ncbi:VTT domain-containing protein [Streptomyces sp. Li-HN-5-11]|uniref:DedA family protein n=1 Tax=Streptomyces sp. Li-HN-5-11 TaxID=3075432 RepID=UPI0028B0C8CE|nr:VTT domain-containing protein [Streptomyces sp. Li-HN-5-11]WNM29307.1 VTT domain-containing protein [Streptomyces sp. Li-HN-5-11]
MMTLALGPSWLDPNYLLGTFGIWGLLLVVFAESGLLIGFFLPGDSLLFTCGLLITSNKLDFPLWGAIALICLAAILGDQAGYMFGKKVGPSLFNRPDSRLFKQENVTKAHEFFEKYGPKSLVLARFVPIVRTFTPIIAGVSGMRYRSFLVFNVIGGVLWGAGVTLLGSWLGNVALVKNNIEAMLVLIVLISVVPIIIEFLRARSKAKNSPQEPAAPAQQQFPAQYQEQYQQPVMDDATTRLRRIEPEQPYGHEEQHYGRQYEQPQPQPQQPYQQQPQQQDWDQRYYDQQQYPQPQQPQYGQNQSQQAQQPQYGQNQNQQAQQPQYGQNQQPQQQPDYRQNQQPQAHPQYDQNQQPQAHPQYDQNQYPYDYRQQ